MATHYILELTLYISGYGKVCLKSEHENVNQASEADTIFREIISKRKMNKDLELRCNDAKNVTSDWDRFIIIRGSLASVKTRIRPGSFDDDLRLITPFNTYNYRGLNAVEYMNPMADAIHEDLDPT